MEKDFLKNVVEAGLERAHFDNYYVKYRHDIFGQFSDIKVPDGELIINASDNRSRGVNFNFFLHASDKLYDKIKRDAKLKFLHEQRFYENSYRFFYASTSYQDTCEKYIEQIIKFIFNSSIMMLESGCYESDAMFNAFKGKEKFIVRYSKSKGNIRFIDPLNNETFWVTKKVTEYKRYDNGYWYFIAGGHKYHLTM